MNSLSFRPLVTLSVAALLAPLASNAQVREAGEYYAAKHVASNQAGELSMDATFCLWVPEGLGQRKLRGIIVHQHGCGEGASKGGQTAVHDIHWQALAKKWDCALLGPVYHQKEKENCRNWCDPRNGSDDAFQKALRDLAAQSGRPELETVPWCLWGHSGGGFWASLMLTAHPERIAAVWFRSGTAFSTWEKGDIPKPEIPAAAYGVPLFFNPGIKEKDDKRFNGAYSGSLAMAQAFRAAGAPAAFGADSHTVHECGDARYLAIPFFDTCLAQRLPAASAPAGSPLKKLDLSKGFLAPWEGTTFSKQAEQPALCSWLPTEAFAKSWKEYVTDGAVTDLTPPPAPFGLTFQYTDGKWVLQWQAEADLQSGLAGFRIERDGVEIARIPETSENRFGRPVFQGMSYHDTPEVPKDPKAAAAWFRHPKNPFESSFPLMRAEVAGDPTPVPTFTVRAVNTVGATSLPAYHRAEGAKPFLACDYVGGAVAMVNAEGTVLWSIPARTPQDCWQLPDGGVLYCEQGGAVKIDAHQNRIWEYKAPAGVECHSCQPLPNGNVLVAEGGTKRLVEVNSDSKIVFEVPLPTQVANAHNQIRGARKLANSHYVVALKGDSKVAEIDATGKIVREIPVQGDPHECVPLPDGNLLITCGDGHRVFEVDPKGTVVWEINENDLRDFPLRLIAGAQRLPNGNTILCNFLGHGHLGMQPQFVEVTRDKQIVWRFDDHRQFKSVNQIHVLSASDLPVR